MLFHISSIVLKNKKRYTRQLLSLKFMSGHNFKIKQILDLAIICELLVVVRL